MALRDGIKVMSEAEVLQGSDQWRAMRLGVLTGSRCSPVLVEKRPSATRDTLKLELVIERVTGKSPKVDYQSDAMLQGLEREAEALRYYEAETLNLIRRPGFVYWVGHYAGCTPDGYVGDWDELVSIKCRELRAHYQHMRFGDIPADALRQMAHELWVVGNRDAIHNYVSFNPDFEPGLRYNRVPLTWDQLRVDHYAQEAEAFLREVQVEYDAMQTLAARQRIFSPKENSNG
jgi:hypothetical protein